MSKTIDVYKWMEENYNKLSHNLQSVISISEIQASASPARFQGLRTPVEVPTLQGLISATHQHSKNILMMAIFAKGFRGKLRDFNNPGDTAHPTDESLWLAPPVISGFVEQFNRLPDEKDYFLFTTWKWKQMTQLRGPENSILVYLESIYSIDFIPHEAEAQA